MNFLSEFYQLTKQHQNAWHCLYLQMIITFTIYAILAWTIYHFYGGFEFFGGSIKSFSSFVIIAFVIGTFSSIFNANRMIHNIAKNKAKN